MQPVAGTAKPVDRDAYVLVVKNGTLRAMNHPKGATRGTWRVSANGVLCVEWKGGGGEACDVLTYAGGTKYQWGGGAFQMIEGNAKNL